MRALARCDYDRGQRIMDWPMREVFLAYLQFLKDHALEEWRWARIEWAALKPRKKGGRLAPAPKCPPILRDDYGG